MCRYRKLKPYQHVYLIRFQHPRSHILDLDLFKDLGAPPPLSTNCYKLCIVCCIDYLKFQNCWCTKSAQKFWIGLKPPYPAHPN